VDDNFISHVDSKAVSSVIKKIEDQFGKMTVTRGIKHMFLGMNIEFKSNDTAEIDAIPYIREAIIELEEKLFARPSTPVGEKKLKVDCSSARLDDDRAKIFHSILVTPRSRPDISLPISFLCSRGGCSTEENWAK